MQKASEKISEGSDTVKKVLGKKVKAIDEKLAITESAKLTVEKAKTKASELNEEFHIEEYLTQTSNKAKESIQNLSFEFMVIVLLLPQK